MVPPNKYAVTDLSHAYKGPPPHRRHTAAEGRSSVYFLLTEVFP